MFLDLYKYSSMRMFFCFLYVTPDSYPASPNARHYHRNDNHIRTSMTTRVQRWYIHCMHYMYQILTRIPSIVFYTENMVGPQSVHLCRLLIAAPAALAFLLIALLVLLGTCCSSWFRILLLWLWDRFCWLRLELVKGSIKVIICICRTFVAFLLILLFLTGRFGSRRFFLRGGLLSLLCWCRSLFLEFC